MEKALPFRCHDCKNSKTKDQFTLCKLDNEYGVQGEPDHTTYVRIFTGLLHEQTLMGVISCFSTQGLAGEADEICTGVVGRV